MAAPVELLRERLKAFLLFLRPKLLVEGANLDRLAPLRRAVDQRLRAFVVGRARVSAADACEQASDPRTGRFDETAAEAGLVPVPYFAEAVLPLGEDMSLLVEVSLVQQVVGPAVLGRYAREFVASRGLMPPAYTPPPTPKPLPAAVPPLADPVARLLGGVADLWSVPAHTHKILEMLNAPETPPEAVCAEIEKDPALAAQCLRVVNSSTYGLGSRIASIKRAVVTLGYQLTRRIVCISALASRLGRPHGDVDFDLRGFWRDSLAVAHASRLAASASRKGSPDEHFSAGLLHGIGKLVEYQHLRPQLRRILAEVRGTGVPWDQAERRLLGTTYAEIGGALCERWRFPASIAEAARRHLDPPAALADPAVPREALVVGAARALLASRREPELLGAWSPLLHVPADRLPGLLDEASGLAATGVGEIFPA